MHSIQSTPLHPNLQKTQLTIKGFTFFNQSKSTAISLTSSTITDAAFILSENAVKLLGQYAKKQNADPMPLGGVGNMTMESLGAYNVTLPQYNGQMVTLSGLRIRQITSDFPIYPLKDVEDDIQ